MVLLCPPTQQDPATPSSSSDRSTHLVPELVSDATDTSVAPSIGVEETSQGLLLQSPHRTIRIRPSQLLSSPICRSRRHKATFSPQLMTKDRFNYKRRQAVSLAQAYHRRIAAEEQETIRHAEEEAVLEDSSDLVNPLSARRALRLARATREAVHASHQVALSRLQVARERIQRLEDQVEESRHLVRMADLQVAEVLQALAAVNYEGMSPEDLDPEPDIADYQSDAHDSSLPPDSFFQKLHTSYSHTKIQSPTEASDTHQSDIADQSEGGSDSENYDSDQ